MIRELGKVAEIWLNHQNPFRKEAVTALQVSTGFSKERVEAALFSAFHELTEDKIRQYIASDPVLQKKSKGPDRVLHVLAGNVFTSWLPGAVTTLLLGSECHLKPSSRETVFPALWKHSLKLVASELADRVHIVNWSDTLLQNYLAIVAYGSDETLSVLKSSAPPDARFVGYGHKVSVAVIWKDAWSAISEKKLFQKLQQDAVPFDLEGCLSPRLLFLEGQDPQRVNPLASEVAVMPHVERFDSWSELRGKLQPLVPQLSALGYAGGEQHVIELKSEFAELGFSRICEVGEMQQPPLTWRNGGISLAEELTRP